VGGEAWIDRLGDEGVPVRGGASQWAKGEADHKVSGNTLLRNMSPKVHFYLTIRDGANHVRYKEQTTNKTHTKENIGLLYAAAMFCKNVDL